MLYVSAYDKKTNMFSVTDTDDGTTELIRNAELMKAVRAYGLKVSGVDTKTGHVSVQKMQGVKPKKPVKRQTRADFLEEQVGFDYIVEQHDGRDFTEFVISMGGDVLTYRVYGQQGSYSVYAR